MKNYVKEGESISVALPYDRLSGEAFMVQKLLLVSPITAPSGASVDGMREGVFTLPKLSTDVVAVGVKLNWNNTTKQFQLATSDLDGAATAVEAAGNGVTSLKVVLTPV